MLPRQVVRYSQLLGQGLSVNDIKKMCASLKLFPTPFKGIYYVPSDEERKGWFIDKPLSILTKATALFLGSNSFYYTCTTAEEFWGINWRPAPSTHIVNGKKSGRIDLKDRIQRNLEKRSYRSKKIARILSFYGDLLVFHRIKDVEKATFKGTPYGKFASRSQLRRDKQRFRCR